MAGVEVVDKENLTPAGTLSVNLGKRPNEWNQGNDENAKRKALLRPSTRFTNVKEASANVQQPSKAAVMGPPPPRIAFPSADASSGARPKLVAPQQQKTTVVSHIGRRTFKNFIPSLERGSSRLGDLNIHMREAWCCLHRRESCLRAEQCPSMQLAQPAGNGGGSSLTSTLADLWAKGSLGACTWPGSASRST